MSFWKFLNKKGVNPECNAVVKSKEHGVIWSGKIEYMSTNFMPGFFDRRIENINRDRQGYIVFIY